jgi:MinD-like ATPase involved in chromosome partitioning or flagellar assembly
VRRAGGVSGARPLRRHDVFPGPLIDGRKAHDHSLVRFKRRVDSLLVSRAEREEAELERRLRAQQRLTRPNLIASASPKGGVGKTTSTFLAGNVLASHLKLRAVAVDANPGFGTLGRLSPEPLRPAGSLLDLLRDADRLATAAELRPYVSCLPSGLHLLAAPHDPARMASLGPERYGELVALLSCFYEVVLLDLVTGMAGPLARFAAERADQVLLMTTPSEISARLAINALDHLDRDGVTVVLNRAHPRLAPELRAIEECLRQRRVHRSVTLPDDRRLALMLDSGTYSLGALDRTTRVAVKRLGVAVAERLV